MTDMTSGNPVSTVIRFAIPLMAASIIQQMYALTDAMVLGICGGNQSLAILGACSWPNWLQVSTFSNMGQAACLLAAVRFGSKNEKELKKAVGNIYVVSAVLALILVPGFQMAIEPFLRLQNTPTLIFEDAVSYLRIVFLGTFFFIIYSTLSSLLRAVGDSMTSFIAIFVSVLLNIVIDIILVAGLGMGVKGAAVATALSQMLSALVCIWRIRRYPVLCFDKEFFHPDGMLLKEYAGTCLPMMAQSIVIAVGGTFVHYHVNYYGIEFAAGVSAANKIFVLVETGAIALASAGASFVSQNVGAGKFKRIWRAVGQITLISLAMAAVTGVFLQLAGNFMLSFFAEGDAVSYGMDYLKVYSFGILIMYPMYLLRQALQALGNVKIPLVAAVLQLVMRFVTAGGLTKLIGCSGIYFANVAAWAASMLLIGIIYPHQFNKCKRTFKNI